MNIKRYIEFIKESNNSLGERVESLYDDDYVKNIVNRFLTDIKSDIRLSNAINLLSDDEKREISKLLDDYQKIGIVEKEPNVSFSTDLETLTESEITPGGKGAFTSFLKVMTALGQKDIIVDFQNCPDDMLLYYQSTPIETGIVKSVMARYKSLSRFVEDVDYRENEIHLYFGIRCTGELEYGSMADGQRSQFGNFKLSTSSMKWISSLESKSAFSLKKELVNLTTKDIQILGDVKSDMQSYNPGYKEDNMNPTLVDRIISFGLKGVGKWDNGVIDEGELQNIKSNFVNWVMGKKWGDKVLISLKASSYWLYIHIKLK